MAERRTAERRAGERRIGEEQITEGRIAGGRKPFPERALHPRSFYMGDFGPYTGEIKRGDTEIRRDVESALFYDSWVDSKDVNVDVDDGVVTLSGTVHSRFEKRSAGDDAWDVPGVKDVCNSLQVQEETT
ncbi:MAG: BON domain-containing protein [Chloroflexi bacterium]|nr:BON domain-containing protein [Chloroflexota bacterium]